jgi:hypothetical protein
MPCPPSAPPTVARRCTRRYPTAGIPDAFAVYRGACVRDEFADNDDGNLQWGTSGRGAAQWLLEQGLLSHFDWCATAEDVADWIGARDADDLPVGGPICLGTDWYWEETDPDGSLYMPLEGQEPLGGHEVCLLGWNERGRYFTGVNSWGTAWGIVFVTEQLDGKIPSAVELTGADGGPVVFTIQFTGQQDDVDDH